MTNPNPLRTFAWTIAGIIAGLALAFVLLIAVELASAVVHPLPPDFAGTQEEMCAHVARYPAWVLALVVPAWALTAFAATWTANRLGGPMEAPRGDYRRPLPHGRSPLQRLDAPLPDLVQDSQCCRRYGRSTVRIQNPEAATLDPQPPAYK